MFDFCHVSLLNTCTQQKQYRYIPSTLQNTVNGCLFESMTTCTWSLGDICDITGIFLEKLFICVILYQFIIFFLFQDNVQYRLLCKPVMTLIDTFDVCIFLGREADRLCIGASKSANNICVNMNGLSFVFTKFIHPYDFI